MSSRDLPWRGRHDWQPGPHDRPRARVDLLRREEAARAGPRSRGIAEGVQEGDDATGRAAARGASIDSVVGRDGARMSEVPDRTPGGVDALSAMWRDHRGSRDERSDRAARGATDPGVRWGILRDAGLAGGVFRGALGTSALPYRTISRRRSTGRLRAGCVRAPRSDELDAHPDQQDHQADHGSERWRHIERPAANREKHLPHDPTRFTTVEGSDVRDQLP